MLVIDVPERSSQVQSDFASPVSPELPQLRGYQAASSKQPTQRMNSQPDNQQPKQSLAEDKPEMLLHRDFEPRIQILSGLNSTAYHFSGLKNEASDLSNKLRLEKLKCEKAMMKCEPEVLKEKKQEISEKTKHNKLALQQMEQRKKELEAKLGSIDQKLKHK